MTALNKQALRDRYSPQPVPKCHICGAVMTIARASAGAVVYACSGCTYDDNGAHYAPGRSLGDDHYSASRVTIFESSDPEVLALLDELEAAEKRIAELSASHSKLRDTMAAIHNTIRMDGGYTPLAAILNAAKRAYEESASTAGIGVNGE
ncbi:ead/Ea22-like family protein [Escherichia coli]|nr:ead/Ea22-like family protein [Escherichia coli]